MKDDKHGGGMAYKGRTTRRARHFYTPGHLFAAFYNSFTNGMGHRHIHYTRCGGWGMAFSYPGLFDMPLGGRNVDKAHLVDVKYLRYAPRCGCGTRSVLPPRRSLRGNIGFAPFLRCHYLFSTADAGAARSADTAPTPFTFSRLRTVDGAPATHELVVPGSAKRALGSLRVDVQHLTP